MEINSKIHVEQPAPPGVPTAQRSQKRDGQTSRQKNSNFLAVTAAGEIRAPPNLAWL